MNSKIIEDRRYQIQLSVENRYIKEETYIIQKKEVDEDCKKMKEPERR